MTTEKDVARWMLNEINNVAWLYQEIVLYKILDKFGKEYVYPNANGNFAISKKVLSEFRKLTERAVVWDRREKAWRKLNSGESYIGRQVKE